MSRSPQPRYLCVHVPEFPAQARLRHRHDLRHAAVVILDGTPPLETVCSATRLARQWGVVRGNTRAELEGFAGVEMLARSIAEEESAAAALLAAMWNFSPRVQVVLPRRHAHALVADITGTERIFGAAAQLARTIQRTVRELSLLAHLCVSDNFHTAVCAAPYSGATPQIVAPGAERAALAPLPLAALDGITDAQQEVFAMWGLHTLGELAALPEKQLIARMGQAGKRLWLIARGEQTHLLQPEEELFVLQERTNFDAAVEMLDSLLFVVSSMLHQLVQRAMQRALALSSVTVVLQLTKHAAEDTEAARESDCYTRTIKPALPLSDSRVLLKLLHLELQAHPPGAPVISAQLEAEAGEPKRAQLGLFSPPMPEPSQLDVTLARIRAMVGEGRVGRPALLDSHRPDSFTVQDFSVAGAVRATDPKRPTHRASAALGLRRIRPAQPIRMQIAHAKPASFHAWGRSYRVTAAFGPWRQSGNWWSAEVWSREEWDVTASASDGSILVCRIVRDLLHKHWLLDGLYD